MGLDLTCICMKLALELESLLEQLKSVIIVEHFDDVRTCKGLLRAKLVDLCSLL